MCLLQCPEQQRALGSLFRVDGVSLLLCSENCPACVQESRITRKPEDFPF